MFSKNGSRPRGWHRRTGHRFRTGGRDLDCDYLASAGDEIVSTTSLYGGTYNLFHYTLPKLGIKVRFVDGDDFDGLKKAINSKNQGALHRDAGQSELDVAEIETLARIAHDHKVPFVIDNTSATPALVSSHRVGSRHCRQFGDQVYWRPRHLHRRRDRGRRQIRLEGLRPFPELC